MDIEIQSSVIHKHVGTDTTKVDVHSLHHIPATYRATVNIGQAFLLQHTNNIQPKGVCGSYIKLIR